MISYDWSTVIKRYLIYEGLADADDAFRLEAELRNNQIGRRRTLADTTRSIIVRAVAGAEIAVILALFLALGGAKRNAAQMGAHAQLNK